MALTDRALMFAKNEAFTGNENFDHIDLNTKRRMVIGTPVWFVVNVNATADASSGNETYSVILEQSDSENFAGATTLETVTIPRGTAQGTQYVRALNYDVEGRYIRARATAGGTTPSCTVTCYLTVDAPSGEPKDMGYKATP